MPDAKFQSVSFSNFGNMKSQNFPLKKKTLSIYAQKVCLTFLKEFLFPKSFFSTQNCMSVSAIFKQRKIFSFSKFLTGLDEKRAAATPLSDQFC